MTDWTYDEPGYDDPDYSDEDSEDEDDDVDYGYGNDDYYDYHDGPIDGVGFADPGGRSSLRAETEDNPRDCDCPTCGAKDVLTRIDRARGYQCDGCADAAEGGGY